MDGVALLTTSDPVLRDTMVMIAKLADKERSRHDRNLAVEIVNILGKSMKG